MVEGVIEEPDLLVEVVMDEPDLWVEVVVDESLDDGGELGLDQSVAGHLQVRQDQAKSCAKLEMK